MEKEKWEVSIFFKGAEIFFHWLIACVVELVSTQDIDIWFIDKENDGILSPLMNIKLFPEKREHN